MLDRQLIWFIIDGRLLTEIESQHGPTAAPVQDAARAEDVRVQLDHDVPRERAPPRLDAVAGRELGVQELAEQRKDRVKDTAENETVPRREMLLAVVHVRPGAPPMGHDQRRDDEQGKHRVTDVQESLGPPVRCLGHGFVALRKVHAIDRTAREQVATGPFPWRGTDENRITVLGHIC